VLVESLLEPRPTVRADVCGLGIGNRHQPHDMSAVGVAILSVSRRWTEVITQP